MRASDAVAGLEHVGAEGRGLDLVVQRLVAVIGVDEVQRIQAQELCRLVSQASRDECICVGVPDIGIGLPYPGGRCFNQFAPMIFFRPAGLCW